jgi:hypothetical protein
MGGRGELAQVPTGLGQDHLGGAPLDPWDRRKQLQHRCGSSDEPADLGAEPPDGGVGGVDTG